MLDTVSAVPVLMGREGIEFAYWLMDWVEWSDPCYFHQN